MRRTTSGIISGLVAVGFMMLLAMASARAASVILDADAAFQMRAERIDDQRVRVSWTIAEGYYLYRDHIVARELDANQNVVLNMPEGIEKQDPLFGYSVIYKHSLDVSIAALPSTHLQITFQGCKENAVCYPPVTKVVDASALSITDAMDAEVINDAGDNGAPTVMQSGLCDQISALALHSASFWVAVVLLMFGCISAFFVLR